MNMSKVRVAAFGVSLDGFGAGPNQSLENPARRRLPRGHGLVLPDALLSKPCTAGRSDGETGVDNSMAEKSFENVGAWILGRNMFGPVRGPWPDENWKGWWGEEPPYHCPTFVLTHHRAADLAHEGRHGCFISSPMASTRRSTRAKTAAGGRDVRIGGGVATVRQYLQARLIDELHLAQRPVLLGRGENLFAGLDLPTLGYECYQQIAGERATHLLLRRLMRSQEP